MCVATGGDDDGDDGHGNAGVGLVFTCYISDTPLPEPHRVEMIRYLFNHQNSDGGWGLHIESRSTIFGSVMNYCALRILGVPADHPDATRAREFIQANGTVPVFVAGASGVGVGGGEEEEVCGGGRWNEECQRRWVCICVHGVALGGATGIPSWGKFWMCAMNIFKYEGMNPVPPELWWLPKWVPIHPSKMWCHCRVVRVLVLLYCCYYFRRSYCYCCCCCERLVGA